MHIAYAQNNFINVLSTHLRALFIPTKPWNARQGLERTRNELLNTINQNGTGTELVPTANFGIGMELIPVLGKRTEWTKIPKKWS